MKKKRLMAGVLSAALVVGVLAGVSVQTRADRRNIEYNFTTPALSGTESELLLKNPDRGLRMEVYLDVATGKSVFEYAEKDAIEALDEQIALYESDSPQLVQVYFYLTGYKDKPLDEKAFENMNCYFEELEKHNLKALLRFAYISDDTNPTAQEPTVEQVEAHMAQLKDFIKEHEEQIHVFQMGLVGAWGEWDSGARARMKEEKRIVNAVLENTPEDMYIQVRYLNIKNKNMDKNDAASWNRVGYHDDFLIGNLHGWNTAGDNPESKEWKQMTEESKNLLVDGEMIWGSANDYYTGGKSIDAMLIAKRMKEHHFTSLSLTHNYKETNKGENSEYSMVDWQNEYVNQNALKKEGLPFEPNWFRDQDGNNLPRTMFEYIRDYLGYYLTVETAEAKVNEKEVSVDLDVKNYGFAAPIGLKSFDLVLLDSDGNVVDRVKACELGELQTAENVNIQKTLTKPDENRVYRLAIEVEADDGTAVRLANDMEYWNGYQVLGDL